MNLDEWTKSNKKDERNWTMATIICLNQAIRIKGFFG